jgi:hypothetical protein
MAELQLLVSRPDQAEQSALELPSLMNRLR